MRHTVCCQVPRLYCERHQWLTARLYSFPSHRFTHRKHKLGSGRYLDNYARKCAARGKIFGNCSGAGWLQGALGRAAKSDNYLAVFKKARRRADYTQRCTFKEHCTRPKNTKGRSRIQVNQVVAVTVKKTWIVHRAPTTGLFAATVSCRCSQKDNRLVGFGRGSFFQNNQRHVQTSN